MNVVERDAARAAETTVAEPDHPAVPAAGPAPPASCARFCRFSRMSRAIAGTRSRPLALPADCGGRHAGGADRGPPHDRFRLLARERQPDRQLFRGDDRRSWPCSRSRARRAFISSPRSASASSPICAEGVFRHLGLALLRLLRRGQDRRADLAAHRRHHPDQGGGRRLDFGRLAQPRALRRRHHHDGGDEPAAVRLRARRHSRDRAAALRLRPRGAPALALGAGHARRCHGLRLRTDRRGARAAGLHQRGAGQQPFRRRGRARLSRRARLDPSAGNPHRDCHLSRLRQRGGGAVGRRPGRARGPHERRPAVAIRALCRVRRRRRWVSYRRCGARSRRRPAQPSGCSKS